MHSIYGQKKYTFEIFYFLFFLTILYKKPKTKGMTTKQGLQVEPPSHGCRECEAKRGFRAFHMSEHAIM